MKRILIGAGILALGLAALVWVTGPISGGKGHGGHPSGGGHPPAHVGSVHYGSRPGPAPFRPSVREGTVRSEHYEGLGSRAGYRNPYRDEYFRQFRPGYRPYLFGDSQYYGWDTLPLGYQPVMLNGVMYYLFGGVYYLPYIYGGQTVYLAIPYQ